MQSAYKWTYTKNTYLEISNGKTKDFCLCFFHCWIGEVFNYAIRYIQYPQHNEIYFAKKGNTVKYPLQAKTLIEAEF